jgi:hypothetical protein
VAASASGLLWLGNINKRRAVEGVCGLFVHFRVVMVHFNKCTLVSNKHRFRYFRLCSTLLAPF